ncbi:MAG: phage major capsid protein [Candidatus Methanomethylicaceae archaeon]
MTEVLLLKNAAEAIRKQDAAELERLLQEFETREYQRQKIEQRRSMPYEASVPNIGAEVRQQLEPWLKQVAGTRSAPIGVSPRVERKTLLAEVKAYTLGSTSALRQPYSTGIVDIQYTFERLFGVTPLLPSIDVETDVVEAVQETVVTTLLPQQTEYTSTPIPILGDNTFTKVQFQVATVAGAQVATRQVLEDMPQFEGMISKFLLYKLAEALEYYVLQGPATGPIRGILNTSGILSLVASYGTNGTGNLDAILMAATEVGSQGATAPTHVVFNPRDWAKILQLRSSESYLLGAPGAASGSPTIWGLPVVLSYFMPEGTALVGNFNNPGYAILFDRKSGSIILADQHEDFVVRGLVLILGEMRLAYGVIRPKAFCKVTLTWTP